MAIQKISPFLWFDGNAEEAMNFYVSLFKNSKIVTIARYPVGVAGLEPMQGKVVTGVFELEGQTFMAIDGGPQFPFTEAISLAVTCEDQAEVDDLWSKLTSGGGREGQCGWLKDKFGLSWQVVPKIVGELMASGTPEQSQRAMAAIMKMKKIDAAELQRAYDGKA